MNEKFSRKVNKENKLKLKGKETKEHEEGSKRWWYWWLIIWFFHVDYVQNKAIKFDD